MSIFRQLVEVLAEIHALGEIHRDVRPKNIFLYRLEDRAKVLRLGECGYDDDLDNSFIPERSGNLAYLAPEIL